MTIKECGKLQKKINKLFTDYATAHHEMGITNNDNIEEVLFLSEIITKSIRKINKIAADLGILYDPENVSNNVFDLLYSNSKTEKDFLLFCLNNNMID